MGFWSRSEPAEASSSTTSPASASASTSTSMPLDAAPVPDFGTPTPASAPMSDVWIPEETPEPAHTPHISVPSNLIILPSVAGVVGFLLGARRGGAAARLRFLAENAHRQPTTVQGWYYYLKTRNYKVVLGGVRGGLKYAFGLGSATALYVATEEVAGWTREKVLEQSTAPFKAGPTDVNPDRWGWRKGPVHYEDGVVAGSMLAMVVGIGYRLPNPVLLRALIMGSVAGGIYSALQIAQDKVAALRHEDEAKAAAEAAIIAQAERERRLSEGLPADPEPTEDELKAPDERNFFEKIGAGIRGRDAKDSKDSKDAKDSN